MFTSLKIISRLSQASVIGAAIAFANLLSVAEAKSPMRWSQHSANSMNNVATQAAKTRTSTRGLPSNLKAGVENLSKVDLSKVKVHYNQKPAGKIGAKAFTKGTKIHLAPGQMKHLPHEAWHVTQKNGGRVTGQTAKLKNAKRFSNASKASNFAKKAKAAKTLAKTHQTAKVARHANSLRKGVKAANTARNIAKVAAAGTGVGAVVGITAGLAGVDPIEMATLKATNPAEYNRRMRNLKKNPVKYMGNNIKNNTKKVATNVGNATKKAGCGIGNVFKKKANKKKC